MVPDPLDDPVLRDVPTRHGYKILDPCALYDRIGEGGMGAVYRGRHLNLGIDTAVKVMKVAVAGADDQFVARFQREAMVAASINHAGLIRVFDVKAAHGLHYIVMELVRGETLRQRVRRKGPLSVAEAFAIARAAAEGLGAAHAAGVIHRDIKPDNVLVSADGEVKVLDLGLAKGTEASDTLLTQTRRLMGTPQYMAPEQFDGAEHASPRSDVYALGATLGYMLLGRDPHPGSSVTQIMKSICLGEFPDVGAERGDLEAAQLDELTAATSHDAKRRPADAGELARRLAACATALGPVELADAEAARATTALEPPTRSTVSAIRAEQAASPTPEGEPAGGDADAIPMTVTGEPIAGSDEPTVLPPGAAAPRRSGRVLAGAVALALIGGGAVGAWAWLGPDSGPPTPDGHQLVERPDKSPPKTDVDPSQENGAIERPAPVMSSLERARGALAANDRDGVLEALAEAMATSPDQEAALAWDGIIRSLRGDDPTPEEARELVSGREVAWRALAEAGSPEAEVVLAETAITYATSDQIGLEAGRDDEAIRRLVAAANAGHARAWFYLGDAMCQVARFQNGPLAVTCYQRAADSGCSDGLARLAHRHLYEQKNLYPDLAPEERRRRGRELAQRSDAAGSVRGTYWLAHCLLNGIGGARDDAEGRDRLEAAARRGHPPAIEACTQRGFTVETARSNRSGRND